MPKKNNTGQLEKELTYCKELEKVIEKEQALSATPAVKEKLNLLKDTIEDTQENFTLLKDTDAKTGHKFADSSFFGYKTHLAMTEERIITAVVVISGEKGDGPELSKLLEISQQNGIGVDTIIGDGAYAGKENLKLIREQNIKVVVRLNVTIAQGAKKDEDKFDYNKGADRFVCPSALMAIRKVVQGKKNVGTNQAHTYYFDVKKCKSCPLKKGCYNEETKTKTYSVSIKSDFHQKQISFQETGYYKEKAKHRYKIEQKNSELKNVYGYDRGISYGITNM